jgi:hypothetical protein
VRSGQRIAHWLEAKIETKFLLRGFAGHQLQCSAAARYRSGETVAEWLGRRLEHDPEKCEAVFRKDHAQSKS